MKILKEIKDIFLLFLIGSIFYIGETLTHCLSNETKENVYRKIIEKTK